MTGQSDGAPVPMTLEQARGYLPALDGVRGIAILLVLLCHVQAAVPPEWHVHPALWMFGLGWAGVDLFFALSGFLITSILLDTKDQLRYFRNFYGRRAVRIFPLYYGWLVAVLVIAPPLVRAMSASLPPDVVEIFTDPKHNDRNWWYWLYISNWLRVPLPDGHHPFLDITWTLAIEEQFYLVWPLIVYLCRRKALVWVCIAMIAIAYATRLVLALQPSVDPVVIYVLTPCRMDTLAIGALLAVLIRRPGFNFERWVLPAKIVCAAAAVAVVTLVLARETLRPAEGLSAISEQDFGMQVFGYTIIACGAGALVYWALTMRDGSIGKRVLSSPVLVYLGKISYGTYLLHWPVVNGIAKFVFPGGDHDAPAGEVFLFAIVAMAASVLAGSASWYLWEMHFLRLKRLFRYERKTVSRPGGGDDPPVSPRRARQAFKAP